MIRISDKSMCCGCSACVNACPSQCIVPRYDREGFYYPVANPDLCINCGRCEQVCPVLNPLEPRLPSEAFAVRCEEHLAGSSSGGVFPALAGRVIDEGGVVYGAALAADMKVEHTEIYDKEELGRLRGSKYVQSELYSAYEEVRDHLKSGRKVLFSGTPCQVAGLLKYLGSRPAGLLTVDVACHGVPSPLLWEKYVKALEEAWGCRISSVGFRDKSRSWRHYDMTYCKTSRDGRDDLGTHTVNVEDDVFMSLFRQDMTLRPSCYRCPARNGRSGSDITLADLWSVAEAAPELNDDRGVSLVLVSSSLGKDCLDALKADVCRPVDPQLAVTQNGGFAAEVQMPPRREEFFKGVHSARNLITYMKGFVVRKPIYIRLYRTIRRTFSGMKRRMMK